jgi:hypothetical protein
MANSEAPEARPSIGPETMANPAKTTPEAPAHPPSDLNAQPAPEVSDQRDGDPQVDLPTPVAPEPAPEPVFKLVPMRQWSDLTQSEHLDVLWTLCEWQFQGAMRLRSLLGEEDSGVGWVSF